LYNPGMEKLMATTFCTVATNIFNILTEFSFLTYRIYTTSHASSRKRNTTMEFTGHSTIVGSQIETII